MKPSLPQDGSGARTPKDVSAVVLGASAGAIQALTTLLPPLPRDLRVPVIIVVHVLPRTPTLLTQIFGPKCACPVHEPEDKEPISPAVWFGPPDYHLLIASDLSFALSQDDPVKHSRPAIDALFESAARVWGARLAAFVLTGASEDGASGAASVRAHGGDVYIQDPDEADMATMPRAAILATTPTRVAPLAELSRLLVSLTE
ncbi:MAG: chemotaxis protein CheB [Polyangiaceae bacterium]